MAKPPVFAELGLEDALARSRANQAVVIVDAMAAWCGPCRAMDRTTWVDPRVVARLTGKSSSFAIQLDVDAEPALAAQLEVTAMPTLIAFASGVEHDRLVGGRSPEQLIEWLDLVEAGDRFEDAQRRARAAFLERRAGATALLEAARYDEALAEYQWLWAEARTASVVAESRRLVAAHAPARTAFTALRDAATPTSDGESPLSLEAVFAWITLNEILGDADATLRWYDANIAALPPSRTLAELVEVAILPLLIERARWSDIGVALADPVATFLRLIDEAPDIRALAANLVRALYAAGREERANDVEYEARSADPSAEMTAALATAQTHGRDDRATRRASR